MEGQAVGSQSYTWTTNEQPTNASRVGRDACSIGTKRHKMEGPKELTNAVISSIVKDSLPTYLVGNVLFIINCFAACY